MGKNIKATRTRHCPLWCCHTRGVHLCMGFRARLCQMALKSGRHVKVLCKKVLREMQEIPNYSA